MKKVLLIDPAWKASVGRFLFLGKLLQPDFQLFLAVFHEIERFASIYNPPSEEKTVQIFSRPATRGAMAVFGELRR